MSTGPTDRCYIGIPKWAWNFAFLGALGALVTAVASWVGGELKAARDTNEIQAVQISTTNGRVDATEKRIDSHDRAFDRIDTKLDQIWQEVRRK